MNTVDLLLKHYNNRPFVALAEAGEFWGLAEKTMKEKIDAGRIRLPYFTLDGQQKTLKLVRVVDLARIMDEKSAEAGRDFAKLWN